MIDRVIDYSEVVKELKGALEPDHVDISQDLYADIKQMLSEIQKRYNPDINRNYRVENILAALKELSEGTPDLYEVEVSRVAIVRLLEAWHQDWRYSSW